MDTITHGLTGAVIGYCGFRQRDGRAALWTAIAASEFPDIDIVLTLVNSEAFFRWHRGPTHSVLLLPLWSALVAWAIWAISGRRNFRLLWMASAAGVASHLALDWITSYGTMLLWPLNDARLELSWVFILDPYVWAMLGVILWAVLRKRLARAAPAGLAIVSGYFLLCGASHFLALRAAVKQSPTGRVAAFAQPLNPYRWTIVRDEGDVIGWNDGENTREFVQFHDERLLPKAEATDAAKLFRWFAEFPLVEKREENGHTVLRYRDLRFRTRMPWGGISEGLFVIARVTFDKDGNVITSELTSEER